MVDIMGFCPNCGSYVSPGTNVCSCGTSMGYAAGGEEQKVSLEFKNKEEEKRKIQKGYWKKAKKLMDEGKYLEAIEYIDMAMETSKSTSYTMAKAKAYYFAGMYENALPLFRESISPHRRIDDYVTYVWIGDTLTELNRFDEAMEAYQNAIDIINDEYERSVTFFKGERWMGYERIERACASALEEKNERISDVKERIAYSLNLRKSAESHKSDHDRQEELLKTIGKRNLITIAGTRFHANPKFEKSMKLTLIKEKDNEFDGDAIAVYADGVKVGYAANSDATCCPLTSKASDIKISDVLHAEYVMHFAYSYHVARIIK